MSPSNPDLATSWLKLGLNTVLPLTAIVISLIAHSIPPRGERVVLGDILCVYHFVVRHG